ncbi:MAG: hypothetical protein ACRDNS_27170, partial [Trebonia sp.]
VAARELARVGERVVIVGRSLAKTRRLSRFPAALTPRSPGPMTRAARKAWAGQLRLRYQDVRRGRQPRPIRQRAP